MILTEGLTEETDVSEINKTAQKKEDPEETDLPDTILIRSVFLEKDDGTEKDPVLICEKETEAVPDEAVIPDYNFRAPECDEFALSHDGAVLNGDHYRLCRFLVSGTDEKDFIDTDLPVEYEETDEEKDNIRITMIYEFIQPWHYVTIHYEDIATGEELFESEVQKHKGSSHLKGPVAYDVKELIKIRFAGYRMCGVSGDTMVGESDSDKDIRFLYEKEK